MEPRTRAHLARADHHRDVALALIGPVAASLTRPPPLDWAVVAAFYAAVHYVNAYLWETQHWDPGTHQQRAAAVTRTAALRAAAHEYRWLMDLAYQARYVPHFRESRTDIEGAVLSDLEQVRRAVLGALGLTP